MSQWLSDPAISGRRIIGHSEPDAANPNQMKSVPGYIDHYNGQRVAKGLPPIENPFAPGTAWHTSVPDLSGKKTTISVHGSADTGKEYGGVTNYVPHTVRYFREHPGGVVEDVTDALKPLVRKRESGANQGTEKKVRHVVPHMENFMGLHADGEHSAFLSNLGRDDLKNMRGHIYDAIKGLTPAPADEPISVPAAAAAAGPTPAPDLAAAPQPVAKTPRKKGISERDGVHSLIAGTRLAHHLRILESHYTNDPQMKALLAHAIGGGVETGKVDGKDAFAQIGERLAKDGRSDWANAYRWNRIGSGFKLDQATKKVVDSLVRQGQPNMYEKVVKQLIPTTNGKVDVSKMDARQRAFWDKLRAATPRGKDQDQIIYRSLLRHAFREQDRTQNRTNKAFDWLPGYVGPASGTHNAERFYRDGDLIRFESGDEYYDRMFDTIRDMWEHSKKEAGPVAAKKGDPAELWDKKIPMGGTGGVTPMSTGIMVAMLMQNIKSATGKDPSAHMAAEGIPDPRPYIKGAGGSQRAGGQQDAGSQAAKPAEPSSATGAAPGQVSTPAADQPNPPAAAPAKSARDITYKEAVESPANFPPDHWINRVLSAAKPLGNRIDRALNAVKPFSNRMLNSLDPTNDLPAPNPEHPQPKPSGSPAPAATMPAAQKPEAAPPAAPVVAGQPKPAAATYNPMDSLKSHGAAIIGSGDNSREIHEQLRSQGYHVQPIINRRTGEHVATAIGQSPEHAHDLATTFSWNNNQLNKLFRQAHQQASEAGLIKPDMTRREMLDTVWNHPSNAALNKQAKVFVAHSREAAGAHKATTLGVRMPGTGLKLSQGGSPERFAAVKTGSQESDFSSALQRLRSANHMAYIDVLRKVLDQVGMTPHKIIPVLHGDHQLTRPAVAAAVMRPADDRATMYAAAWHGLLTRQPSILAFRSHPDGKDSLYQLRLPGGGDAISHNLTSAGIIQKIMIPDGDGFRVLIHDQGKQMRPIVGRIAQESGTKVGEVSGTGHMVGGSDMQQSRASYRKVIDQTEGASQPQPASA
jgi:hypothetical protein